MGSVNNQLVSARRRKDSKFQPLVHSYGPPHALPHLENLLPSLHLQPIAIVKTLVSQKTGEPSSRPCLAPSSWFYVFILI